MKFTLIHALLMKLCFRVEIHPAKNNGILLRIDGNMFSARTRAQKFMYMKCKTAGCEVHCRYLRESKKVDKLEGEHNHIFNTVHGYQDSALDHMV